MIHAKSTSQSSQSPQYTMSPLGDSFNWCNESVLIAIQFDIQLLTFLFYSFTPRYCSLLHGDPKEEIKWWPWGLKNRIWSSLKYNLPVATDWCECFLHKLLLAPSPGGNVPGINQIRGEIIHRHDLTCLHRAPRWPTSGNMLNTHVNTTAQWTHQGQEAESLITFTVQTVAAGSDAQDIKSSLCTLHAINQTT